MGLLERLFTYRKGQQNIETESLSAASDLVQNENAKSVLEFGCFIQELLDADRYVARSEYLPAIKKYAPDVDFFDVLQKSDKIVRFDGWQNTTEGQKEVKKALRSIIWIKYKLKNQEVFDQAYSYIEQYY